MDQSDYNKGVDERSDSASGKNGRQKCSKCHEWKSLGEFYYRDSKPDRICKDCKKSSQKDNYKRKTFADTADVVIGDIINKVLDYKIARARIVEEELGRLIEECETTLRQKTLNAAS